MRILMLGNSFTTRQQPAASPGLIDRGRSCMLRQGRGAAVGAAEPRQQAGQSDRAALQNEEWDYVVLQEMSHGPITAPRSFFSSVEGLCRQIRANGAVPILFATWAYQRGGAKLTAKGWDYNEMARTLSEAYHKAARENNTLIADVGRRFYELPGTRNLYAADGVHPSELGSHIAAETIASVINQHEEAKL